MDSDTQMATLLQGEPMKLLRRIGSTTFEVAIHFSDTGKDTMADIVRRILEREVDRDGRSS